MIYFYVCWIGIMINKCLPIYYYVMFDIFRILTHCIPVPLNTQDTNLTFTKCSAGVLAVGGSACPEGRVRQCVIECLICARLVCRVIGTRTISFG